MKIFLRFHCQDVLAKNLNVLNYIVNAFKIKNFAILLANASIVIIMKINKNQGLTLSLPFLIKTSFHSLSKNKDAVVKNHFAKKNIVNALV